MDCVETTLSAAALLASVPGLRERTEEALVAILDAAREIRRLQGFAYVRLQPDQVMRVRVANHCISYTLDLDANTATVVYVEPIADNEESAKVA